MPVAIGDIPEGTLRAEVITHAALASNGGSAAYGIGTDAQRFRMPQAGIILGCDWEPTGGNQANSKTASYRQLKLYNGSTNGAGTVVLGSLNMSATLASNNMRAMTMQTNTASLTAAAGELIAVSHISVGGNDTMGTVLVAGVFHIKWRPI